MTTMLFLTPELPFPAHSGGKLKSLKLLEHFSERFDVTLCCPLKNDDHKHVRELKEQFPDVELISKPVAVKRNAFNLIRSYMRSEPLNVFRTASEDLKTTVASMADQFEIVFLDHYETGQFLPESFKGTVIYHGHNAYFKLWETYSQARSNPLYKVATRMESMRVKKYEAAVANRADLVFAAPEDLTNLTKAGVSGPTMAETYHLGDYGTLNSPRPSWYQTKENLVYVGYLGWEANAQGLLWFIKHVWPKLSHQHPNLKLKIVGKGADDRLKNAVAVEPNIALMGFVEDLDEVFNSSHICVAPLTFGSGMKVKVLSALSRGIPVVTTPIGAESISAEHNEHIMIAKTSNEMLIDINELLENQETWLRLAKNARSLIRNKYTWENLFSSMDASIDVALGRVAESHLEEAA